MLKVIFVGLFIDLLAFTLILPLLPGLLDHYKVIALCIPTTHSKYLKVFTQACLSRLKLFWAKGKHKKPGLIWTASWRVWVVRRSRVKGQTVWSNCGSTRSVHPSALWGPHRINVLIFTIPGYAQFLPPRGGNGAWPPPNFESVKRCVVRNCIFLQFLKERPKWD